MLTLGINYSQMHDSAACIVRDGELLFAVAEERVSRLNHDARFAGHRTSETGGVWEVVQ
jgi:carbamoyltransferase